MPWVLAYTADSPGWPVAVANSKIHLDVQELCFCVDFCLETNSLLVRLRSLAWIIGNPRRCHLVRLALLQNYQAKIRYSSIACN